MLNDELPFRIALARKQHRLVVRTIDLPRTANLLLATIQKLDEQI